MHNKYFPINLGKYKYSKFGEEEGGQFKAVIVNNNKKRKKEKGKKPF